jgi:hypothetical protein
LISGIIRDARTQIAEALTRRATDNYVRCREIFDLIDVFGNTVRTKIGFIGQGCQRRNENGLKPPV